MSDEVEEWRAVPGFPNYEVSDWGRVRSIERQVEQRHHYGAMMTRKMPSVVLKVTLDPDGYETVNVYVEKVMHPKRVHRLVLLAFVGPKPDGLQGCHWNGIRTNNRLSNLRYGTPAENSEDALRHGTVPHSEAHRWSKLDSNQVADIRAARGAERQVDLAERYGVKQAHISRIQLRGCWKHVP